MQKGIQISKDGVKLDQKAFIRVTVLLFIEVIYSPFHHMINKVAE
jgi:hypothetical protein